MCILSQFQKYYFLIFFLFGYSSLSKAQDIKVTKQLIFPSQNQHVHSSSLVSLPNGDLLASWFQGSGERKADDVKIMGARLKKGYFNWSKPFEMADLDARVRAVLRRRPTHHPEQLVIVSLTLDYEHRQVIHEGHTIGLAKKEFAAFECLAESSGRTVSKSNLMNYVYGVGEDVNETTLEVLVSRLRKKLSKHNIQINMARGLGYFLKAGE